MKERINTIARAWGEAHGANENTTRLLARALEALASEVSVDVIERHFASAALTLDAEALS